MASGKEAAARLLCAVGAPAIAQRQSQGQLAILMYHGVEPVALTPPCWHVLDAVEFRRQMEYVRERYQVLPLVEALERLDAGTLPDHAATLTFDDGTRNLAVQAAPILRSLDLPAAVFLSTGPMGTAETLWPDRLWLAFARTEHPEVDLTAMGLGPHPLDSAADRGAAFAAAVDWFKALPDEQRIEQTERLIDTLGQHADTDPGPFEMLSWPQAHDLAADGLVTLHPHTVTHPILSRCSDEKVQREIVDSCRTLERETGCMPKVFAYPNGRVQDFDERAKQVLRGLGVRWALSTVEGLADRDSDPLALPRLCIGSDLSFARFQLLVSGALT
ncbi:MAG: polysaccharide deacetylase family protein [Actinomycetia bacterium]|nr:polysaccharide deacetylase family protein [Actinomycetes bacterium]MCH9761346.1 polysaccharide deacetylase family protein [Actinomycetes bacterium]